MDKNGVQAFLDLFESPLWYCTAFIIPVIADRFESTVIDKIKLKLKSGYKEKTEVSTVVTPQLSEEDNSKIWNNLGRHLEVITKFIRPIFILIYLFYILLISLLFVDEDLSNQFILIIYLVYFVIAFVYNVLVSRTEIWKRKRKYERLTNVLKNLYLPVTYAHLVLFLYFLVAEYFFNLIVLVMQRASDVSGPIVIGLLPLMGLLTLKDMLNGRMSSLKKIMVFVLLSIEIAYIILAIAYWYKLH